MNEIYAIEQAIDATESNLALLKNLLSNWKTKQSEKEQGPQEITFAEARRILNISGPTLRNYIKEGRIIAVKVNERWVFQRPDVENFYLNLRNDKLNHN